MSTSPQWTDSGQTDLLALVAEGNIATDTAELEWREFVNALRFVANSRDGAIPANDLRPLIRGVVAPRRIGAFVNRALNEGLIGWAGEWQVSDDHEGRNAGRPAKTYRWLGDA